MASLALLVGAFSQILSERNVAKRQLALFYSERAKKAFDAGDRRAALTLYAESNRLHPTDLARMNALALAGESAVPLAVLKHDKQLLNMCISSSPKDGKHYHPTGLVVHVSPDGLNFVHPVENIRLFFLIYSAICLPVEFPPSLVRSIFASR